MSAANPVSQEAESPIKTFEAVAENSPESDSSRSPEVVSLDQIIPPSPDDGTELLKKRFLCRGGGMLFNGPTGIGKSSAVMQMCILWALGLCAFGIQAAQALKILIIQAENDEGDLAEMRDGVLKGMGLFMTPEGDRAMNSILICSTSEHSGGDFFDFVLEPALREHRPDLVVIDPAFAFLGASAVDQEAISCFLRNRLNPLLKEFNCGAMIVHHSNKPQNSNGKPIGVHDHAYIGSGSAEWANWARAVLTLTPVTNDDGKFILRGAKRGSRLGWKKADGSSVEYVKHLWHSKDPNEICWKEVEPPLAHLENARQAERDACDADLGDGPDEPTTDPATASESIANPDERKILERIPPDGTVEKKDVIERVGQDGLGKNRTREAIKSLVNSGTLFEHKIKRTNGPPAVHLALHPQATES